MFKQFAGHPHTTPHSHGHRHVSIMAVASLIVGLSTAISTPASAVPTFYSLTYIAGPHGSLSGSDSQTVQKNLDGTPVAALADAHYHFVNWSDASTANPRTDTDVTADITVTANFAIDTFTLTYTPGANGTITGISPQTVNFGESGTAVTAVPTTHYHFVDWSDGVLTPTRLDTTVAQDLAVTANFVIDTRTVTYSAGTHGMISGTSPQVVDYGESTTAVTAVPDTGYHFVSWSDASVANPRIDSDVTTNISVTASFAIDTFTLTYTPGANGTITGVSPQIVNYGESGTAVTAVPLSNYHFVDWSDGVLTATRRDTTVEADLSVTANFAFNDSHTLTYVPDAHGTIVGTTPQTVAWDASGTSVTAVGDPDYVFWRWSDELRIATRTDTHVIDDLTVHAEFWKADNVYIVTYLSDGHGSISGGATQNVPQNHDGGLVTAVAAPGHHFLRWSDDLLTATRFEEHVTESLTLTAYFEAETFTLTYGAGAHGSVSGTISQIVDYGHNGTAVTAIAHAGYHFTTWSDGVHTATRVDTNVMANKSVTAYFALNVVASVTTSYTLTYIAGANGTLAGTAIQVVVQGANGSAVTATPNAGYHFASWSDGVLTATRTDTNVQANHTVTANFAANTAQAALTLTANPTSVPVGGTSVLTALGGSGTGAISYATSTPAICSVSATGVVTTIMVGVCTVTATKAADGLYLQAVSPAVSISVTAAVVPPTITRKTLSASAYFAANSAVLSASGLKKLAVLVRNAKRMVAKGYVVMRLVVKGYVQPTRSTANDNALSSARAKAVVAQLRKLGVTASITALGMGKAPVSTPAGRHVDTVITLTLTR